MTGNKVFDLHDTLTGSDYMVIVWSRFTDLQLIVTSNPLQSVQHEIVIHGFLSIKM